MKFLKIHFLCSPLIKKPEILTKKQQELTLATLCNENHVGMKTQDLLMQLTGR